MKSKVKTKVGALDFELEDNKSRVIQCLAALEAAIQQIAQAAQELIRLKGYDPTEDLKDLSEARALIRRVQGGSAFLLSMFKGWSDEA